MTRRRLLPRPKTLRARLTLANVAFVALGLLATAAFSVMATYMVLGSEIDNTLRDSQRSVSSAPVTSRGLQQLCTLAGILQDGKDGKDGGLSFAKAFKQDLFVVLDSDGRNSSVCENSGGANSRIREDLGSALDDPAALARSGKAVNVRADGTDYRVVVTRLSDGSMVVQGMRYSGLEHAIHKLLVWESAAGLALLGLLAVGSLTAARRRLSPLETMVETASAIAEGDLSRRIATARHGSSEVRQLSTALNAMLQQIETALTESERATAQLRHFLADASHELRTPLASVQGYLQLYEKGMLDADDKERALHRVSAEAKRMSRLVDELLALARLEERPALDFQPVDVCALVRDAAADLAAQQPGRPQTLRLPADERAAYALGDEAGLRQVVGNLLSNVRVHTPPDAPLVIAVDSAVDSGDAAVRLRIADSGPGLDPRDASRAFDRFFRADPERAPDTGGAGLGMAIVQAVVQAHHGTVTLDTAPGRGLTVLITLPAAGAPAPAAAPKREPAAASSNGLALE
ncbi:sensor histidine kinase [Actinacidiphila bryophytorum]|uniref:sensor histidine kinase n=1 Tax=Actinacidiphila bryophytorum TaxID=1436133 RepID=UPI0021769D25|nr:HAMP domain-containing sensor histidine kinase [Actinacidiphila bryophytorum]UWE12634.1 HAMP domain-containing histidine kinase [Actinacidiphila bryophytorum]